MDNSAILLWGSLSSFPKGQSIHAHAHESFFHLFYCVKGTASVRVDSQPSTLSPEDVLLAGMSRSHELLAMQEDVVAGELKFTVDAGELRDRLNALTGVFHTSDRVSRWLRDLFDEIEKGNRGVSAIEQAMLSIILLQMVQDQTPNNSTSTVNAVRSCTAAAIRYIQKNYCRSIRLEDIAADSGYNANYLCTAFKRDTCISVNEYINMLRIHKAADMILYGDLEISQVASICGFQGSSHFSNTFRRHAGLLPTECRQLFFRSIARIQVFPTHPRHEKAIQTPQYIRTCEEIARIDALAKS